jgi:hypothetical protein
MVVRQHLNRDGSEADVTNHAGPRRRRRAPASCAGPGASNCAISGAGRHPTYLEGPFVQDCDCEGVYENNSFILFVRTYVVPSIVLDLSGQLNVCFGIAVIIGSTATSSAFLPAQSRGLRWLETQTDPPSRRRVVCDRRMQLSVYPVGSVDPRAAPE